MKWTELLDAVGGEPLFESGLLMVGDVDPRDITRQLSRWTSSGKLVQLRRGLYTFGGAEARGRRSPDPYEIANRLVPGSYVSLSSVLARESLIPEYVPTTTSVTVGRTARYVTPLGTFVYQHVRPSMLWGYEAAIGSAARSVRVAVPEKALIDLVYLDPEASGMPYMRELRLQNLDRLRLDVLATMAERCGVRRVIKAAALIAEMAADEGESYQPWVAQKGGGCQ